MTMSLLSRHNRTPSPTLLLMCTLFLSMSEISGGSGYNYYPNRNARRNHKLLLILIDGCRWDYPDQDTIALPGFRKLAENGVRAPYVTPIFPSNSYPNWYTLVTGLYAENHGFVQNMMYDPYYGDLFLMAPNDTASVPHWWEWAEPIWVTAEKHGLRSALYWWDGCQVDIKGRKPTFCRKYKYVGYSWPSVNEDTKEALLTALDLFDNDEIELVQIYYEPVDFYGHKYGPNSPELKQAVKNIDSLLDLAQTEMVLRGLTNKVNMVVVSDHGMTSSDSRGLGIINLQQIIEISDIRYMIYYGATSMILPYEGKLEKSNSDGKDEAEFDDVPEDLMEDEYDELFMLPDNENFEVHKVYEALKGVAGVNVYKKEEIPEHYHVKRSRLTLPLLLVASKNYYIQGLDIPGKSIPTGSSISLGSHGYDPYEVPDMRGIFFARGPGLRRNYISPPLQINDIYNVLCDLLGIEPLPNNGTKSITKGIVVTMQYSSSHGLKKLPLAVFAANIFLCLCSYKYNIFTR